MRAVFVDASDALADVAERLNAGGGVDLRIHRDVDVTPDRIPAVLGDAEVAIIDHTHLPTDIALKCKGLRHVVFLGTGARSYMNPEELEAARGISVHIIKGYGDTAVAEMAFALMWAAAKSLAAMDGAMRGGQWLRMEGMQLTGKTLGLLGYGGIGAEMARLARGIGMKVIAWNRTPRDGEGVEFVPLERLLAESHAVSVHLLLTDETRGFLDTGRLGAMRPGAILVNTARGALVDEDALVAALESGRLAHAALDVFDTEPLPPGHRLAALDTVTLSAHSAFRTLEASETLMRRALDIAAGIAQDS